MLKNTIIKYLRQCLFLVVTLNFCSKDTMTFVLQESNEWLNSLGTILYMEWLSGARLKDII